jgi:hypothetical protein
LATGRLGLGSYKIELERGMEVKLLGGGLFNHAVEFNHRDRDNDPMASLHLHYYIFFIPPFSRSLYFSLLSVFNATTKPPKPASSSSTSSSTS